MIQKVEEMDEYTLKRWMALIEGVNHILDHGKKAGISSEDINLSQNHLVDFIDERTERIKIV